MDKLLHNFFYPESVCVAGASTKEKSIGYELLKTIKNYGYTGRIFPVNPKTENILGYECYKNVNEIKEKIDLAIVVVPKKFVENTINELLSKNVKSIILITAGFKEIGNEGADAEKRLLTLMHKYNARLIGPNCMGVINSLSGIKLNATFVAEKPETGKSGFLSQSGALGAAVLNSLRETDIRFAHFISVGNKADVNENDILQFWQNDENIEAITLYLESFVDGFDFIYKMLKDKSEKPVIVLKAGRTEAGMRAASSHTGALSGKDKVTDALLKQFGIIRAADLNEMFNTAKGFENFRMPKGNKIGVVTNAGGPAILAVDALEKEGLQLATLSENTKLKLREIVHPEGSVNNPVDLLPGGSAEVYKTVNELLLKDENVDAVVSVFVEPVMVEPMPVVEGINSIVSDKPVFQVVMPLPEFWSEYRYNPENKIPLFKNPEDPAEVISNLLFHTTTKNKLYRNKNEYLSLFKKYVPAINSKSEFASNEICTDFCRRYNIPLIEEHYFKYQDLCNYNGSFPAVLKGINKKFSHKSDLNAVKLNIRNSDELLQKANEIKNSFAEIDAEPESFLVQPFIEAKHELLVGGYRDSSFGPVIMFGSGGKYVETLDDTAMISAIAAEEDINNLIASTKIGKILHGVRNEKSADIESIKRIIKAAQLLLLENGEIIEFDFNPVIVDSKGKIHVVDVRIKLSE